MPNITDLYASVPGTKADWKVDWKEDAKADWNADWKVDWVAEPVFTAPITVTGDVVVGETLTVVAGTVTGAPAPVVTYEWSDSSTAMTYVVQAGDVGSTITVTATATNSEGTATSVVTTDVVPPVAAPNEPPAFTSEATISGTYVAETDVSVVDGTVTGNPTPTLTYQWTADGVDISGATSENYTIAVEDVGSVIGVVVTATNSEGTATSTVVGAEATAV